MFFADAQSLDPEELQVLDIFLPMKFVVRTLGPNIIFRHTEDSLHMIPSPYLHHKQQSNI